MKILFLVLLVLFILSIITLPIIGLILGFIQGIRVENDWEKQNRDANIIRKN